MIVREISAMIAANVSTSIASCVSSVVVGSLRMVRIPAPSIASDVAIGGAFGSVAGRTSSVGSAFVTRTGGMAS